MYASCFGAFCIKYSRDMIAGLFYIEQLFYCMLQLGEILFSQKKKQQKTADRTLAKSIGLKNFQSKLSNNKY